MTTDLHYHKTPEFISEFIYNTLGDGIYIDVCSGDGSLTSFVDDDCKILVDIKKYKNYSCEFIEMDIIGNLHKLRYNTDFFVMNPPFEKYHQYLEEVISHPDFKIGAIVIPNRLMDSLSELEMSILLRKDFGIVDFGTSKADVSVLIITKEQDYDSLEHSKNDIVFDGEEELYNTICSLGFKILDIVDNAINPTNIVIGSLPFEQGLKMWRIKVSHYGVYLDGFSVWSNTKPTLSKIVRSAQYYLNLNRETLIIKKTGRVEYLDINSNDLLTEDSYHLDDLLESGFIDMKPKLSTYQTLSWRIYRDNKFIRQIDNDVISKLLSIMV